MGHSRQERRAVVLGRNCKEHRKGYVSDSPYRTASEVAFRSGTRVFMFYVAVMRFRSTLHFVMVAIHPLFDRHETRKIKVRKKPSAPLNGT